MRTDLFCTECNKTFIANLDLAIEGNHVIHCPYCDHIHYRKIEAGKVTSDRWDSKTKIKIEGVKTWKHSTLNIKTQTTCSFLKEKWLDFLH